MSATLLLTDAEPETRGLLERELPRDGFESSARVRVRSGAGGDVAEVDRWIERAPVIVLGRERAGAVQAFRRGCDDYVTHPFEYQELVERSRAVLRRVHPMRPEVVEAPPVRMGTRTRVASVAGRRLVLAQKE